VILQTNAFSNINVFSFFYGKATLHSCTYSWNWQRSNPRCYLGISEWSFSWELNKNQYWLWVGLFVVIGI